MQVIGHRGARGLFPENTLEGFRATAALGVSTFELDVGMTADGIVVVCHDQALDPDITRDGSGRWVARPGPLVCSLTMPELAHYDVGRIQPGSPTSTQFPDQRAYDGARIPTLASVLGSLRDSHFIIELKTDPLHPERSASPQVLADGVLAVVDQQDAATRVVIEAFDWRVPRYVTRIRPEIPVAWLTWGEPPRRHALWWDLGPALDETRSMPALVATAADLVEKQGIAGRCWAPEYTCLTEALVTQAHALGLSVLPWTVNRPQDVRRLASWRVDGLISDRPDIVLATLGR